MHSFADPGHRASERRQTPPPDRAGRTSGRSDSCRGTNQLLRLRNVLVAAAGQANEDRAIGFCLGELKGVREGMRRLERANYTLAFSKEPKCSERLSVA